MEKSEGICGRGTSLQMGWHDEQLGILGTQDHKQGVNLDVSTEFVGWRVSHHFEEKEIIKKAIEKVLVLASK